MKRIMTLLLVIVLCLSAFSAQGMEARYHAEATVDFHLRESPKESGKRIALINEGSEVIVSEYGNAWSKIIINQKAGYAKSEWLSKFVALDPFADPVPEHQRQIGVAKINTPVLASVDGYSGNILSPGDIIAVRSFASEHALVNVMREVTRLPKDSLSYTALFPGRLPCRGISFQALQPSSMKRQEGGLQLTVFTTLIWLPGDCRLTKKCNPTHYASYHE